MKKIRVSSLGKDSGSSFSGGLAAPVQRVKTLSESPAQVILEPLRNPDPIDAGWIICPLRVAEID